jgi:hypothetical protein
VSGGEMPQASLDPISRDCIANRAADDKANACPIIEMRLIKTSSMNHQRGSTHPDPSPGYLPEVLGAPHSQRSRQHRVDRPASGGQAGAALATPGRNDGAAGAGPHPQTETMGTAATPIARLERALAHGRTPTSSECSTNQVRC